MIFLFHGNNNSASREAFTKIKDNYKDAAIFSLSGSISFGQFQEACEPLALLGGNRLVMVETYLGDAARRKTSFVNDERLITYLKNKLESTHVALWFDKELPSDNPLLQGLGREKSAHVFCTNITPPNVFSFLEELANRRRLTALRKFCYWQKAGINNVYLLTMVAWQMRRLLAFFYGTPLGRFAPITSAKLVYQVKNFSEDELLSFYDQLYDLDMKGKSSEADLLLGLFRLVEKITR